MYYIIYGAVRRRTGQALMVAVLAALAATAAAAGPWYGLTVASQTAAARVDAAAPAQRVITVHRAGETGGDPRRALDDFAATARGLLPLPGAVPLLGLADDMSYTDTRHGGAVSGLPVAYRDGFCDHVRLTGSCPAGTGQAAVSAELSGRLGLRAGDGFQVRPTTSTTPVVLRVTAVYQRLDPDGEYWSDQLFRNHGDLDPVFTSLDTFRQPQIGRPTFAYDVPVPRDLLRGDNGYDLNGVLNAAQTRFAAAQIDVANPTGALFDAVLADRATVLKGLAVALGQLLVLAWFAIGLAGRFTGRDRRADAGLLKLRGSTGGGMLRLAVGQHLLPLLAGAVAGLPAGFAAAWLLAGALPVRAELWTALLLTVAAVGAVLLGGLLVLTAVDALAQRAPVAVLLRRVPSARGDWRSGVVDAALIALAAGAVYQARSGGPDSGLGVVAPALVALAVGLLLARLLRRLADRAGGVAVRAGRLRLGLTAVQVSRQPGADRVFALVVVAVAMVALAAGGFGAGRAERADRADVELGAARVLTVGAVSRTALEYAVRRADPGGRDAMAVVVDTTSNPPVLAVDSPRLAAVATWRDEYGPVTTLPTAIATSPVPSPLPLISGNRLSVLVDSERAVPTLLGAVLQNEATGAAQRVEFRNIRAGRQTVTAPVPACAVAPGCRLISWQLFPGVGPDGKTAPGAVTIRSLAQLDPAATVLDTAALADVSRWHTDYTGRSVHAASTTGGLRLAPADQPGQPAGNQVSVVDAPLPVPIVLAGPRPATWRYDDAASSRFGGSATPVRVAGAAQVLPVLGANGVLADLDAIRRLAGVADLAGTFQVWLRDGAPATLPDALRAEGLTVLDDRTAAGRTTALARDGAVVTAPFGLFTVAVAVLLAAAMVAVAAAADRGPLTDQLRALRTQGLPRRTAVVTGYAGIGGLALAGLLGGLVAALIARPVAGVVAPPFADGWRVIPPPGALGPGALALAAAVALLVLGPAAWLSVRPLARRLHGGDR